MITIYYKFIQTLSMARTRGEMWETDRRETEWLRGQEERGEIGISYCYLGPTLIFLDKG